MGRSEKLYAKFWFEILKRKAHLDDIHKWENDTKTGFKETVLECGLNSSGCTWGSVLWALVNGAMNLRVP